MATDAADAVEDFPKTGPYPECKENEPCDFFYVQGEGTFPMKTMNTTPAVDENKAL
jgi:hypothetical protein